MLTSTAQFTPKWGAQLHRNIHTIREFSQITLKHRQKAKFR